MEKKLVMYFIDLMFPVEQKVTVVMVNPFNRGGKKKDKEKKNLVVVLMK